MPGKRQSYSSKIRNCDFIIDNNYLLSYFDNDIEMHGVFGVPLYGNHFENHRFILSPEGPQNYGIGILAENSGFNVGSTTNNPSNEPCFPDNCTRKSEFFGLQIGILAGRTSVNQPFQVYNSEFSNCFVGIWDDGVSGSIILLNNFHMGTVPEIPGDEDQIGVALSGMLAGFTIEENNFSLDEDHNADNKMGIVAYDIGGMNKAIRKNTFNGMTVGNEAFGINETSIFEVSSGLHYLCNSNNHVELNDFYLPPPGIIYSLNSIRVQQALISPNGTYLASGNIFSSTGPSYSDFANYGTGNIEYYYYNSGSQIPNETIGIITTPKNQNTCPTNYCLHPCIDENDLSNEIEDFYDNNEDYNNALAEEEWDLALSAREKVDSNLYNILRFFEYDTANFELDTLRAWYLRAKTLECDYLLAGNYYSTNNYSLMDNTLDSIPSRFHLSNDQEFDLTRVKYIYNILESRSISELNSTDIDSLIEFSGSFGESSTLARNVLVQIDSNFIPRYYIPGELYPRSSDKNHLLIHNISELEVFPNPTDELLNINVPIGSKTNYRLKLFDINGLQLLTLVLSNGENIIPLNSNSNNIPQGMLLYIIYSNEMIVKQGKIVYISK